MERRDKESRQSSLPSSLIPHLYSRPQHSDPLSTTAYQTILPLLAPVGKDEEAASTERTELPPIRSSFALPLVPSSFGPPGLLDDPRRPKYPNYETRLPAQHEQESNFRTASPADHPASGIIRSMGSLSLPSHVPSQRYASPIYSDPLYRTTRPERTFHGHSYPLASQETAVPRSSWREGEAGPSSLVHTIPHDIGGIRGRRGSSQPAQITRQSGTSNYRGGDVSDDEERRGRERERYLSEKDLCMLSRRLVLLCPLIPGWLFFQMWRDMDPGPSRFQDLQHPLHIWSQTGLRLNFLQSIICSLYHRSAAHGLGLPQEDTIILQSTLRVPSPKSQATED